MKDEYFMELKGLAKAGSTMAGETEKKMLAPFIPKDAQTVACLCNHQALDDEIYDYVVLTDKMIYFAIFKKHGKKGYILRSVKCFKASDVRAVAYMLYPEEEGPQIRLMLSEDKRIKLRLQDTDKSRTVMQRVAASPFFHR